MDIGTGKDLADYDGVPYHLIDICEPGTKYNLFQYQQDFFDAYEDIRSRGVLPILCGGTGLYIEAVLKGYHLSPVPQNPELRQQLEGRSLDELTQMLKELKAKTGSNMHNTTDVDSCQRAIRAIEIESYNLAPHALKGTEPHNTHAGNRLLEQCPNPPVLLINAPVLLHNCLRLINVADQHPLHVRAIDPCHHLAISFLEIGQVVINISQDNQQDDHQNRQTNHNVKKMVHHRAVKCLYIHEISDIPLFRPFPAVLIYYITL